MKKETIMELIKAHHVAYREFRRNCNELVECGDTCEYLMDAILDGMNIPKDGATIDENDTSEFERGDEAMLILNEWAYAPSKCYKMLAALFSEWM